MVTAASDIPLEFGADPAMGGCLGGAGDASVAIKQMFSRRSSCRIILKVCTTPGAGSALEGGHLRDGLAARGGPWKRETSRKIDRNS